MDIKPVVISARRRPVKGLLPGALVAAVPGVGAIQQAIVNTPIRWHGQLHTLPAPARVLMGLVGVALCVGVLLALMMIITVRNAPSLTFSLSGLTFGDRRSPDFRLTWHEITAARLVGLEPGKLRLRMLVAETKADLSALKREAAAGGSWYELPFDLDEKKAVKVEEALHHFRPRLAPVR